MIPILKNVFRTRLEHALNMFNGRVTSLDVTILVYQGQSLGRSICNLSMDEVKASDYSIVWTRPRNCSCLVFSLSLDLRGVMKISHIQEWILGHLTKPKS